MAARWKMPSRPFAYRLWTVRTLQIVYASTSGHTEYVVSLIAAALKGRIDVTVTRVEQATPETLMKGDVLLLASGSWNTGGIEGQMNPYMDFFLKGAAKDMDLKGKNVAIVALGDERYRYTAKAGDHLEEYVTTHGGVVLLDRLVVVNEPYGQEAMVRDWAEKLFQSMQ
jgi:flavodoxin